MYIPTANPFRTIDIVIAVKIVTIVQITIEFERIRPDPVSFEMPQIGI